MSTQKTTGATDAETAPGMRRRGLIAGVAALAAGVLAARAGGEQSVAAGGNSSPLVMGLNDDLSNTPTVTTTVFVTGTTGGGLRVKNAYATGAVADTTRDAIQGYASNPNPNPLPIISNSGVHGRNDDLNGIGVAGVASNGTGVYGQSTNGSAVGATSGSGSAVYAVSTSGNGVYGQTSSGNGVYGQSTSGPGVYGLSNGSYGVVGVTTQKGFSACTGISSTVGAAAFAGSAPAGAYAAYFTGTTVVAGDFTVVSGMKNAAVKDARGQHRLMHCVEAPEAWFEDFGDAKLVGGAAEVALDTTFAELVHTDAYHVYLTAHGETRGLYVAKRTATGFSVRENQGGTSSTTLSWRLVAKRADIATERLAKFDLPKIKMPDVAQLSRAVKANAPAPLPNRKP